MSEEGTCTRCRAQLAAGQEYCLECGLRRVTSRQPVHWAWPVLAAALVAAGGAAAAVATATDDPGPATIVALQPLRPASPQPTPGKATIRSWPRRNGYTIVLSVVPAATGTETARDRAAAAAAAGLPDVGILSSSRYSSLHPGYWIVFTGVYRTLDEALAALPRAVRHTRTAYAQQITH
ncbi:MAG TPA: hypothetical protein VFR32_00280 [Gaiellaceae bacterium]|nr:hypothetical protein [Gaiellaceae bacterium]